MLKQNQISKWIEHIKKNFTLSDFSIIGAVVVLFYGILFKYLIIGKFAYYSYNARYLFERDEVFQIGSTILMILCFLLSYILIKIKPPKKHLLKQLPFLGVKFIIISILLIPLIILSGKISILSTVIIFFLLVKLFDLFDKKNLFLNKIQNWLKKEDLLLDKIVFGVLLFCVIFSIGGIMQLTQHTFKKEFLIATYKNEHYYVVHQTENYSYLFKIIEKEEKNNIILLIDNTNLIKIDNSYVNFKYQKYDKVLKKKPLNLLS